MSDPQGSLGSFPVSGPAPVAYCQVADVLNLLESRYPRFTLAAGTIGYGDVLAASMALDEEGPFLGVKVDPEQDRSFPRTYMYGWPNIVSAPSPLMVAQTYPGAWMLDYDSVVPQQVLDWVALECYRMVNLDQTRVVTREGVSGATVSYAPPVDYPKGQMAQLDRVQQALIAPFQSREANTVPTIFWSGM